MAALFKLYILLAISVLFNLYTLRAIFLLSVSSVFPTQNLGATPTPYEFLMFTQQWPKAVCKDSPLPNFTIHGLWPSNNSTKKPLIYCNGTEFDERNMTKALLANLNISWPDVQHRNNTRFWKHEYDKHGTCFNGSQTEYFELSHKMWKRWDIVEMLKNKKIVPGYRYNRSEVAEAIQNKTLHEPNIRCTGEILLEVVVCFEPNGLNVTDCDNKKNNCKFEDILYED